MDMVELNNMNEKQLKEALQEKRAELMELRFKVSERQLKDVRSVRAMRKTIARILTVLNQKQAEN